MAAAKVHPDDAALLNELQRVALLVASEKNLAVSSVEHKRMPFPNSAVGLAYIAEGRIAITLRYRNAKSSMFYPDQWWKKRLNDADIWLTLAHELAHFREKGHGDRFKAAEREMIAAVERIRETFRQNLR